MIQQQLRQVHNKQQKKCLATAVYGSSTSKVRVRELLNAHRTTLENIIIDINDRRCDLMILWTADTPEN